MSDNEPVISDEAVEAAHRAWRVQAATEGTIFEYNLRAALEAAAPYMLASLVSLVSDLVDPDECSFDHHGGCQAHGYLSLEPGETCPQRDAKEFVRTNPHRSQV